MKKKLILFLLRLFQPKYTKAQIQRINDFKCIFQSYFMDVDIQPISKFGITEFQFEFIGDDMIVTIFLTHAGVLVGKNGSLIDALTRYINYRDTLPVRIMLKKSNLWKTID